MTVLRQRMLVEILTTRSQHVTARQQRGRVHRTQEGSLDHARPAVPRCNAAHFVYRLMVTSAQKKNIENARSPGK